MNKLIILTLLLGLSCMTFQSIAQIKFGSGGMFVSKDATVSFDSLTISPSQGININNNTLIKSDVPIPGNPIGSVKRVYKWQSPITLAGTVGIYVLPDDLNGNDFQVLQVAYSQTDDPSDFIVSSGSNRNASAGWVFVTLPMTTCKQTTLASANSVLPLRLLNFYGTIVNKNALLEWRVEDEDEIEKYMVQRSIDGINYINIGEIKPECNGCGRNTAYRFSDVEPLAGNNFYRLQIMELNGSMDYSGVVKLFFDGGSTIVITPNPTRINATIHGLNSNSQYQLSVYAPDGKTIEIHKIKNNSSFRMNTSMWPAGVYLIHLQTEDGFNWVGRLAKQ